MIDFSKLITKEQRAESERISKLTPLSPRQFRDSLVDGGIMPIDVTNAIDMIPDDVTREKMLNAWNHAVTFDRFDPYINIIGSMFDLTPDDIDDMWIAATKSEK